MFSLIRRRKREDFTINFTPEQFCRFRTATGGTLLHAACSAGNEVKFYSLLAIENFPLDVVDDYLQTALDICILKRGSVLHDEFACRLIKQGASLDYRIMDDHETMLHYVIRGEKAEVSKLLIKKGFDPNAQNEYGITPLMLCLRKRFVRPKDQVEIAALLLCSGADPSVGKLGPYNIFVHVMLNFTSDTPLPEMVFRLVVDKYTSMDVHFEVLLMMAGGDPSVFRDMVGHTGKIILTKHSSDYEYVRLLFWMDIGNLRILIEKWPKTLRRVISGFTFNREETTEFYEKLVLENTNLMLESDLRDLIIDIIQRFSFALVKEQRFDEDVALEKLCFLLSYGMRMNRHNLKVIYERYGLGTLLKILLHMEELPTYVETTIDDAFLLLHYDVRYKLPQLLQRVCTKKLKGASKLLPYFASQELREILKNDKSPEVVAIIAKQPKLTPLLELSRNAFRDYFVETLNIRSSREFNRLVDRLLVPDYFKSIIKFELPLY